MFILSLVATSFSLSPSSAIHSKPAAVTVQSLLTGRFSNAEQAREDALRGKPTALLGGHELVSLDITPHPSEGRTLLMASYRFGESSGSPAVPPFRFRYYQFTSELYMKIYRPTPSTLVKLKSCLFDMSVFTPSLERDMELVKDCDIQWRALKREEGVGFEGELAKGEAIIASAENPSLLLRVKDSLLLFPDEIRILDRVYSVKDGRLLIGNSEGIPYMYRRIGS